MAEIRTVVDHAGRRLVLRVLLVLALVFGAIAVAVAPAGAQGWTCYSVPNEPYVWACDFARAWGNPPYYAHVGLGGEIGADKVIMRGKGFGWNTLWEKTDITANQVHLTQQLDPANLPPWIEVLLIDYQHKGGTPAMRCQRIMTKDGGSYNLTSNICELV